MIKSGSEEWQFYKLFGQYCENKLEPDVFISACADFDFNDYRLLYYKALYYRRQNELIKSCEYILRATEALESRNTNPIEINMQIAFVPTGDGKWFSPNHDVESTDVYFHAGEILSMNDRYDEALEMYKKYQLQSNRLKSYPEHHNLYSFRRFNEYTLSDLINNEVTLCCPSMMNDPFDTLLMLWSKCLKNRCQETKHVRPLQESYKYYRIRSFVEDTPDINAIENLVMWSHYADEHKGLCLCYDFADGFTEREGESITFKKIIYADINQKTSIDIPSIKSDLGLYTKHSLWSYENEVRLISYRPGNDDGIGHISLDHEVSNALQESSSRIKSIYFGIRCPDSTVRTVTTLLRSRGISFYRMRSSISDIYKLYHDPINI